ncbi:MAG: hypothetical protein K2M17_00745 [Bacilli bacterium]|nr:hypothetical protein [Bacilli bacterium]
MKRKLKEFNVIHENLGKFEPYDIMPYLVSVYKNDKKKKWRYTIEPTTFDEFKEYILHNSMYQWWGRCEYEIILSDWPCQKNSEKWDIHMQVKMNINIITEIFMENIGKK